MKVIKISKFSRNEFKEIFLTQTLGENCMEQRQEMKQNEIDGGNFDGYFYLIFVNFCQSVIPV